MVNKVQPIRSIATDQQSRTTKLVPYIYVKIYLACIENLPSWKKLWCLLWKLGELESRCLLLNWGQGAQCWNWGRCIQYWNRNRGVNC